MEIQCLWCEERFSVNYQRVIEVFRCPSIIFEGRDNYCQAHLSGFMFITAVGETLREATQRLIEKLDRLGMHLGPNDYKIITLT